MIIRKVSILISVIALALSALGQTPFNAIPDWLSVEDNVNGTGCDFGDVNADAFIDLAVSNGNDIVMAPNFVYMNNYGIMPNEASWLSDDELYSGHCEFAFLDSDNYPELMVANYISPNWRPGSVQIYSNNGGVLETTPSWQTAESVYSFRAAFGDPDGDGDLDLGVATGEAYHYQFRPNLIYFNRNDTLETSPSWASADSDAAYDVQFVDIDNDSDQDLAILTSGGPVKIYYNFGDSIETLPSWTTAFTNNGNSFDFADLNGDGYLDMGVAFNDQLGGNGRFMIFYNDNGTLPTSPDWISSSRGYGSEAVFCDVDGDDDYDFITGRWFGLVYVYLNHFGNFNTSPDWQSSQDYDLVVENIVFGDIDYALELLLFDRFPGDGETKLFHLSDRFLQSIDAVQVDGNYLPQTDFCYSLQDAWVSISEPAYDSVVVAYRTSDYKDMAVSNWGGSTYIFLNTRPTGIFDGFVNMPRQIELYPAYPNPFNAQTRISFSLKSSRHVKLEIFDIAGRRIKALADRSYPAGINSIVFNASSLASGMYFCWLQAGEHTDTEKILLVK